MDSATSAKRRHVQAAAPPAELPLPAPAADPFALQHLLAAHPAALLQAQAGGLAGPLPLVHLPALAYAGYPAGLPGVGGGLDALLAGQVRPCPFAAEPYTAPCPVVVAAHAAAKRCKRRPAHALLPAQPGLAAVVGLGVMITGTRHGFVERKHAPHRTAAPGRRRARACAQALLPQFPFGAPFGLGAQQAAAALLFAQQQQARAALLVAAAAGVGPAAFGAGHAVFGPDYGPAACAEQAAAVPEAAPASPAGSESAPAAPHAGSPGCGWGYTARHAAAGGAKAAKLGSPGGGSAGDAGGDAGGDASGSDDTFGHGRLYRPSARFAPAVPPPAPAAARGSPPPELLRSGSGPGAAPASASVATSAATTATTVHF